MIRHHALPNVLLVRPHESERYAGVLRRGPVLTETNVNELLQHGRRPTTRLATGRRADDVRNHALLHAPAPPRRVLNAKVRAVLILQIVRESGDVPIVNIAVSPIGSRRQFMSFSQYHHPPVPRLPIPPRSEERRVGS